MPYRRKSAWLLPGVLGIALVLVGVWGANVNRNYRRVSNHLEAQRQRAFADMLGHVENIHDLTAKAQVSGSPRQNIMQLVEIWRHAGEAHADLSQVPMQGATLSNLGKFFSQSGEYAYALARRVARGQPLTDADYTTLDQLHTRSQSVAAALAQTHGDMVQQGTRFVGASSLLPMGVDLGAPPAVTASMRELEKQATAFPTLTYDGPFSAGSDRPAPAAALGADITRDQARAALAAWIPNIAQYRIADGPDSQKGARIGFYTFTLTGPNEVLYPDITRQGGKLLNMTSNRRAGPRTITLDQSRVQAQAYLTQHGFTNLAPTSQALESGGNAILSFVPTQDNVLLYPDSIKVKVALDNGQITGLDQSSYLLSHHPRNLRAPAISSQQARTMLSGRLTVKRERLAVIPVPGGQEAQAYEFLGVQGGRQFLVYINAQTGDEEDILQVLQTPEGTLTM